MCLFRSLHPAWQTSAINIWPSIWNHNQPVGSPPWQTSWATCLYLKRVEFAHSRCGIELQFSLPYQNKYYLCIYTGICWEWEVLEIYILFIICCQSICICLHLTAKEQLSYFCGTWYLAVLPKCIDTFPILVKTVL